MPKITNDLIIVTIVAAIFITYLKNRKFSYSLIVASLFFLPVFIINELRISSSYMWVLVLIIILSYNLLINEEKIVFSQGAMYYSITVSTLIMLSVLSWLFVNTPSKTGFYAFIGAIKNLIGFIILAILTSYLSKKEFRNVLFNGLFVAGFINFVAVCLQMFDSNSVGLFYNLYWLPSNTPLSLPMEVGRFFRAYGTFGSPVTLGAVSLLIYSLGVAEYIWDKDRRWYWVAIIWFIVGISSLSKTFIVGSVFVTFLVFLSSILRHNLVGIIRRNYIVLISVFSILISGYILLHWRSFFAHYYYAYLLHPFSALQSRYNFSSNSILFSDTYKTISEYPIFGVGLQSNFGEFIGDSSYVCILHNSGFVGLSISFLFIFWVFYTTVKHKNIEKLLLLLSLLGVSLALPILFFSVYQIPFLLYILSNGKQRF